MNQQKDVKLNDESFTTAKSYQKLKELAKAPFDLTEAKKFSAERLKTFASTACGYKLLYATQRVDKETIETLFALAEERKALEQMNAMQSGEIVNKIFEFPSEERPALHTATRDFFENPNPSKVAAEAAATARQEVEKLRLFIEKLDAENTYTDMVVIGIGGSELGPKVHYEALLHLSRLGRKVHFLGNIDPDAANAIVDAIDLKKSLILVISKTGTTLETLTNEEVFRSHFLQAGLDPKKQFISITAVGSPLDDKGNYLEVFYMWDWIGGRFCTTSMPGAILIAFAYGFSNLWEFLKGANAMDKIARSDASKNNLPLLAALLGIWNRNFLNSPLVAMIPYSHALARYPSHIQQLDMESNGKQIDKQGRQVDFETGPIIFGEPGTNAQHSFFQLIHQGTTTFPVEMIGFKTPQIKHDEPINNTTSQQKLLSNLLAQSLALATGQKDSNPNKNFPGNRSSWILLGEELTPFALGALLAFYEHKVAFQGFIWGINSFDQEGVQLGKKLATKILNLFAETEKPKEPTDPLFETLLNHLEKS